MTEPSDRPFSQHPYGDVASDRRAHAARKIRKLLQTGAPHGALCAEAQADGVPCFELGRDCETCEQAYLSWADAQPKDG